MVNDEVGRAHGRHLCAAALSAPAKRPAASATQPVKNPSALFSYTLSTAARLAVRRLNVNLAARKAVALAPRRAPVSAGGLHHQPGPAVPQAVPAGARLARAPRWGVRLLTAPPGAAPRRADAAAATPTQNSSELQGLAPGLHARSRRAQADNTKLCCCRMGRAAAAALLGLLLLLATAPPPSAAQRPGSSGRGDPVPDAPVAADAQTPPEGPPRKGGGRKAKYATPAGPRSAGCHDRRSLCCALVCTVAVAPGPQVCALPRHRDDIVRGKNATARITAQEFTRLKNEYKFDDEEKIKKQFERDEVS